MVALAWTQTDTVLGKLTNGRKIVISEFTFSAGDEVGTLVIKPLKRIIAWTVMLKKPATDTFILTTGASLLNTITCLPDGGCGTDILTIVSVGE
jgi:hypothetical protein